MEKKEKQEKELKNDRLRCKKCGSSFIYVRIKDNKCVCRGCGFIGDME